MGKKKKKNVFCPKGRRPIFFLLTWQVSICGWQFLYYTVLAARFFRVKYENGAKDNSNEKTNQLMLFFFLKILATVSDNKHITLVEGEKNREIFQPFLF